MLQASEMHMQNNGDGVHTSRFLTRPLYLQARDAIAHRIATGAWKPHAAIPNESELAREFGVSAGTIRKALDLAEAERLLTRRQGRGTFVNDQSAAEHAARYTNIRSRDGERLCGDVEVLSVLETTVNEKEGRRLRLRPHERVHRIRRVRMTGGKPYMIEDVAMPTKLFPGVASHEDASQQLTVMAQRFCVLLGRGEEWITVGSTAPDVAAALHVAAETALLRLDRVIYTHDGKPAEWRLAQCLMEDGRSYRANFR